MSDKSIHLFGDPVDLDELYDKHIEAGNKQIGHLTCVKELGYALYYMQYAWPNIEWDDQAEKVSILCKECEETKDKQYEEIMPFINNEGFEIPEDMKKRWSRSWFKLHFRILDETENMC